MTAVNFPKQPFNERKFQEDLHNLIEQYAEHHIHDNVALMQIFLSLGAQSAVYCAWNFSSEDEDGAKEIFDKVFHETKSSYKKRMEEQS